jgi:hypothetical protein
MVPKKNGSFIKNCCNNSEYISVIYGDCLHEKNCIGDIFRETTVRSQSWMEKYVQCLHRFLFCVITAHMLYFVKFLSINRCTRKSWMLLIILQKSLCIIYP